jgi:hypothetical protein
LVADPTQLADMRRFARSEYLGKYTATPNYDILRGIYDAAVHTRHGPSHPPSATQSLDTPRQAA